MTAPKQAYPTREKTEEAFSHHVSRGKVGFYRKYGFEVVMGERQGATFADAYSEKRWLNCHCNGGVFNLGHRHPKVVEAVARALETLDIGNHHFVSGLRARLGERLAASTGGLLPGVVYGVSGGEAIDLALKLARGVTGRSEVVSVQGGYHGHTGLALAAGDPQYKDPFRGELPGFVQVPFDDLPALEKALSSKSAAVILEPVPATLGIPIARDGYFEGVQALCRRAGAKLIFDEVQTGLGRTGRTWCYQHFAVKPDMVVTGKGLSGGIYPITATLMTSELHAFFDERPFVHVSTFGGSELGCAAALAVLDVIEGPGFLERVEALAARFARGLSGLPFALRQRGLMMGFKFPDEGMGLFAVKGLYDVGIFAVYANNDTSVLQFLPPLTLTDAEADELIDRVRKAFA